MIYRIFEVLLNITVRLYFRRRYLTNQDLVPKDKPVLFVANHQSAFMDPIVTSIYSKRSMYFLARGESFQKKIAAWFFTKLHMIPIYRKEETPELAHKNTEVFSKCYEHFKKRRALLIFPEGSSKTEPRLRKIKTGAARIALGAEKEFDFTLGLTIVPVGINYSNPHRFRSDLHVNFGDPIEVSDFKELYEEDEFVAAKKLTNVIEEKLEERILIVKNEEDEKLVSQVEEVYYGEMLKALNVRKSDQERGVELKKDLVNGIDYFKSEDPDFVDSMKLKLDKYFGLMKGFKGAESLFHKRLKRDKKMPVWFYVSVLILGFTLFLVGLALNGIQYRLIGFLTKKLTFREDFMGSVRMLVGMLVYLISYVIYSKVSFSILPFQFWFLFTLILPFIGLYTMWYVRIYNMNKTELYFRRLVLSNNGCLKQLNTLRLEIISDFEKARKKYNEIHGIGVDNDESHA